MLKVAFYESPNKTALFCKVLSFWEVVIGTRTKLASKAEWYTLCDFAPQNCLLVDGPQSPGTAPYRSWLRVSAKRFIVGRWPTKLHRPMALSRVKINRLRLPMTEPPAYAIIAKKKKPLRRHFQAGTHDGQTFRFEFIDHQTIGRVDQSA